MGEDKPPLLLGWLEKKSPKKVLGNDWQKRYCVINERTHSLVYYKTDNISDKEQGSIDLLLISDITLYKDDSGKVDNTRFNVDMGEGAKDFKFKAANMMEAERWVAGLNAWREYALLNMTA